MRRFTYYSLIALGVLPVIQATAPTFWEVVRLAVIAAGIGWLLLKRVPLLARDSASDRSYRILLLSIVYLFIVYQFAYSRTGAGWAVAWVGLVVAVAVVGVFLSGDHHFPLSRADKLVFAVGGLALLVGLSTQVFLGPEGGQQGIARWMGCFYIFELIAIYFVVSRFLRMQGSEGHVAGLLGVVAVAFGIVCLVGVYRLSAAFYDSNRVVTSIENRRYDEARAHASRLFSISSGLDFEPVSLNRTLDRTMKALHTRDADAESYVAVGRIAEQYRTWSRASRAYQAALEKDPDYPGIHASLGNSLFEEGDRARAQGIYREGVEREQPDVEDYLAFGVALVREGSWEAAKGPLDRAAELGGVKKTVDARFGPREGAVRVKLREFLPEAFLPYTEKLTLFGAVKILDQIGIKALHPGMEIGTTGVTAPVDIVALSGAGGTLYQEGILVGGKGVSLRRRGYNIAVIHPRTGEVEKTANFDTWEDKGEGERLSRYLNALPRGKIVAATINDHGAGGLTGHSMAAFRRFGIVRAPRGGWTSHAAIGVKGAAAGSAIEAMIGGRLVMVGVLASNVEHAVAEDSNRLEALLLEYAEKAPARMAMFIPSLDADATVVIARHRQTGSR